MENPRNYRAIRCAALLATTLPLVSCDQSAVLQTATIRDSLGVTIVDNPRSENLSTWRVSETPVLIIGEEDDASFGDIVGVTRLEDGTIVVADAFARHVRLFSANGTELATVGRRGSGPGEFETIAKMIDNGVDRIGVFDSRLLRLTTIERDGTQRNSVPMEIISARDRVVPVGWLTDGNVVATHNPRDSIRRDRYRQRLELLTHDTTGAVHDSLATIPGTQMWDWEWEMGVTPAMVPFGRMTIVRVRDNSVYVAANDGYRIDRYNETGQLVGVIKLTTKPTSLPARAIETHKAAERAKGTSGLDSKGPGEIFGRLADDAPYPEFVPAYDDLLVDTRGRLWVRDFRIDKSATSHYTVFERNGITTAAIAMPGGFEPTDIDDGFIVGIWKDEFDIESVRVYTLHTN